MILTLLGVSLVVYVAITFLPGSRAQLIMGDGVAESSYQSLHTQETGYFEWLWRILHLDFGRSSFGGQDVASLVAGRIPASLQLALLSLIVALAISTCVVGLSLLHRNAFTTFLYEGLSLASLSLPSFIVALSMILVFSVSLGLLPSGGYVRFTQSPMDCIASLAMPAVCLGFIHSGLMMRMMHSSLERELRRSYVTLARAKGLDKIFTEAGFQWREAGCSMCLAMNPDKLVGDQLCASTSNRNFKGRQGSPTGRTILMSPRMAAAAAVAGKITMPED